MADSISELGLELDTEKSKLKIMSPEMERKCVELANNIDDTIASEYWQCLQRSHISKA